MNSIGTLLPWTSFGSGSPATAFLNTSATVSPPPRGLTTFIPNSPPSRACGPCHAPAPPRMTVGSYRRSAGFSTTRRNSMASTLSPGTAIIELYVTDTYARPMGSIEVIPTTFVFGPTNRSRLSGWQQRTSSRGKCLRRSASTFRRPYGRNWAEPSALSSGSNHSGRRIGRGMTFSGNTAMNAPNGSPLYRLISPRGDVSTILTPLESYRTTRPHPPDAAGLPRGLWGGRVRVRTLLPRNRPVCRRIFIYLHI